MIRDILKSFTSQFAAISLPRNSQGPQLLPHTTCWNTYGLKDGRSKQWDSNWKPGPEGAPRHLVFPYFHCKNITYMRRPVHVTWVAFYGHWHKGAMTHKL